MPWAAPVINTTRSWKRSRVDTVDTIDTVDSVDATDAIDGEVFDDEFFFDLFFQRQFIEDWCLFCCLFYHRSLLDDGGFTGRKGRVNHECTSLLLLVKLDVVF